MKIGLLGFGTVGSGVYEIINNKNNKLLLNSLEVIKVLEKDKKKLSTNIIVDSIDDIINNNDIDLIIEAIGGINPAYEFICKALKNKKHVVTSNKAVVSIYLDEFLKLADQNNVSFKYEASVCGGIPWIKSLNRIKRVDEISKITGIFNGTTNYILYNMKNNSLDFDKALEEAKVIGYAESDPSADIDAIDIMRKLQISINLAFNYNISEDEIDKFGIRNIKDIDIDYFRKYKRTIKLIATAKKNKLKFCANIEPVAFKEDEIEASIPSNFNLGSVFGDTIGELKFYGQGAGKLPTANAIIQDILDIAFEKENYPKNDIEKLKLEKDITLIKGKYYIRLNNKKIEDKYISIIEKIENFRNETIYITYDIESNLMNKISEEYKEDKIFYVRIQD